VISPPAFPFAQGGTVMSDEVWDQYPVLTVGNEIHLNPLGGTLFVQGEPFKVILLWLNS
jgi:hypothetical protein